MADIEEQLNETLPAGGGAPPAIPFGPSPLLPVVAAWARAGREARRARSAAMAGYPDRAKEHLKALQSIYDHNWLGKVRFYTVGNGLRVYIDESAKALYRGGHPPESPMDYLNMFPISMEVAQTADFIELVRVDKTALVLKCRSPYMQGKEIRRSTEPRAGWFCPEVPFVWMAEGLLPEDQRGVDPFWLTEDL
jgi:hypothetical protein